jgi:hypothetical protein
MWYKGGGWLAPGDPEQVKGQKRCQALAFLMTPQ